MTKLQQDTGFLLVSFFFFFLSSVIKFHNLTQRSQSLMLVHESAKVKLLRMRLVLRLGTAASPHDDDS